MPFSELEQTERVAVLIHEMYNGEPVRTRLLAERLGVNVDGGNVTRALTQAAADGLVQRVGRSTWEPVGEI